MACCCVRALISAKRGDTCQLWLVFSSHICSMMLLSVRMIIFVKPRYRLGYCIPNSCSLGYLGAFECSAATSHKNLLPLSVSSNISCSLPLPFVFGSPSCKDHQLPVSVNVPSGVLGSRGFAAKDGWELLMCDYWLLIVHVQKRLRSQYSFQRVRGLSFECNLVLVKPDAP
jgi:hypothetical protein